MKLKDQIKIFIFPTLALILNKLGFSWEKLGNSILNKLENGNYGGALVLEELGMPVYDIPSNKIILTRLNQKRI